MSEPRKTSVAAAVFILLLVATLVLVLAILANFLSVYFVLFNGTPRVSQSAVVTYQVLAGVAIAIAIAGAIVGFARRRIVWGIAFVVSLLVVLLAAAVLAVPQVSWAPAPTHTPLPSNYAPCYSGSTDCPGG